LSFHPIVLVFIISQMFFFGAWQLSIWGVERKTSGDSWGWYIKVLKFEICLSRG